MEDIEIQLIGGVIGNNVLHRRENEDTLVEFIEILVQ